MKTSNIRLVILAMLALPMICLANAACPGPLMYFGAMNTGVGVWWIVISMLTCTLIEGALYQVMHVFRRPYLASIILNGVSLVAGIPLTFVGALVDFCLTATVLSIITETVVAVGMQKMRTVDGVLTSVRRTVAIVLGGNILSNIALAFLLCWMTHLYPPRWTYERKCSSNRGALTAAAIEYWATHDIIPTNHIPVSSDVLLQYLPGEHIPSCPFGGTYQVYGDLVVTCSHRPQDKPLRQDRNSGKQSEDASLKLGDPLFSQSNTLHSLPEP